MRIAFLRSPVLPRLYALACWCVSFSTAAAEPPALTYLFPAGVQQGKTAEITASGKFERWPVQGWANHAGLQITPLKDKGKFSIAASADVPPGVHYLRVHDSQGGSNLRPFFVGTLPEILEQEPNDDSRKPHFLASAAVITGRLEKPGDVDCFAMKLLTGQTLVADMVANRVLGSPCDALLQIVSADGFVLAENNDRHGLDPQLICTAPRDGTYVVRTFGFPAVPDSAIRLAGADNFIYRLTLTTGGFVESAFPVAVNGAAPAAVDLLGWNIPPAAKSMKVPAGGDPDLYPLAHQLWANTALVRREPHPIVIEAEPNDRSHPQAVSLPCTINGRIDPPEDRDVFQFKAQKGQNLIFQVEARIFGSPLTPVLSISDAAGKLLVQPADANTGRRRRNDPYAGGVAGPADLQIAFTAPADGTYRLELRDQYDSGSPLHVYALRALAAQPDFEVKVDTDRFVLTPGKALEINVAVARSDNFAGEVEIQALGLPEGVTAGSVRANTPGKSVKLVLNATPGARSGPIQIIGQSAAPPARRHTATASIKELNVTTTHFWLSVSSPDGKAAGKKE